MTSKPLGFVLGVVTLAVGALLVLYGVFSPRTVLATGFVALGVLAMGSGAVTTWRTV